MTQVTDQLRQLGFSQYEAEAYVALLEESPANGYEVAKRSGVPRPNIYPVLQKLEAQGIALRVDTPEGSKFVPLPPEELISRLTRQNNAALEAASIGLSEIANPPIREYTLNLHGFPMLFEHTRSMMESVRQRLLLILWPEESLVLAEPLLRARQRGVHMSTLCLNGCLVPCGNCQGDLYRFRLAPPDKSRFLVVVRDGEEMLAGEITPPGEPVAVRTRQSMLVKLAEGYIRNSIALSSIIFNLSNEFEEKRNPNMLASLNALQGNDRWFDVMHQLILSGGSPE